MTDAAEQKPAYTVEKIPSVYEIIINGKPHAFPRPKSGAISYNDVKFIEYPGSAPDFLPSCTWRSASGSNGGMLKSNQSVPLERGLIFNIVNTGDA